MNQEINVEQNFVHKLKTHELSDARQSVRLNTMVTRTSRKLVIFKDENASLSMVTDAD